MRSLLRLRPLLPLQLRVCTARSAVLLPAAAARCFGSGGMFDSLTASMGQTFKKLMGRKMLSKEEVDAALASVNDALVDADVAQVRPARRTSHLP
jgi:hypothetical protein